MWGWIFFFYLFVCSRRLVVEKYLLILKYTVNKRKKDKLYIANTSVNCS